MMLITTQDKAE